MNNLDKIVAYAHDNGGIVTSSDVSRMNIPPSSLSYLKNKGRLVQISRGIYALPDIWEDEFYIIQKRYQRGVYSRDTALFLHDLVDTTPQRLHMAFPKNYYTKSLKEQPVIVDRVANVIYSLGISTMNSPMGNPIMVYNKEKNAM